MSIEEKIREIIQDGFEIIEVSTIPSLDDSRLTFGNKGLSFDAAVLFIDIRKSTRLLNTHTKDEVAKLHMAFFHAIVKIANYVGGKVRSFNGDSALVFFHSNNQRESIVRAVKCAMRIKFIFVNPYGLNSMLARYSPLDFGIGIDYGNVVCTKIGAGGEYNRDIFWIGNCVNRSSKYADNHKDPNFIGISKAIFDNLPEELVFDVDKKSKKVACVWNKSKFKYNDSKEVYYYTKFGYVTR